MTQLPEYYFRIRENGAAVFRVSTENRQQRIEMTEIAVLNVRTGKVRPHGDYQLTEQDRAVIDEWAADRREVLADRDIDDIHRAVDYLNLTTQWVQSRASDDDLEEVTDRLLLAMHDLRSALVRRKADRLLAQRPQGTSDDAEAGATEKAATSD